ncbi:galactose mutarotase-like domain-containing protein [Melampsora americana]|nr:galactose mutarotase-like domain-containing protein [Melampsora americana]
MPILRNEADVVIRVSKSQAKIALHGAHVYSWTIDDVEQLFLSSATSITGPAAIRGGIPICFPVFGPPPKHEPFQNLKQHGFARNSSWVFDGADEQADSIQARFSLATNPEIQKAFVPPFLCSYTVTVSGKTLKTSLQVTNPSESDFNFQALLHTYLRLPSDCLPADVLVGSLKGLYFADKVTGKVSEEKREKLDFKEGEVDRVYDHVPDTIEVKMGHKKVIRIKTKSLPNLTVWNPHQEKSDAMGDMEKDGWKRFVCIEPGHTSFVKLGPKASWTGEQLLSAQKIE